MSTTYFVSYCQQTKTGFWHGMIEITVGRGIDTMDDVVSVADFIKARNNAESVVLINWREIDASEPKQAGAVEPKEKE